MSLFPKKVEYPFKYSTKSDENRVHGKSKWEMSFLYIPCSANNAANGTDFWDFIRLVDQGLLPSERGRTLKTK